MYKYLLLKVCQWLQKLQGLLSLLLLPLKNLLIRQFLKRTFSIFLELNKPHKQVIRMDSVLWARNQPNKMDLVLWIRSQLNKMDLVLWIRSQLNKILLLLWTNQLTILIWTSQIHLVHQAYLKIWMYRLNQPQLYLLAMEEEIYSQVCLCQANLRLNNNNISSSNNLNNLSSNNNNHQPKNHLYGMTISPANFLTFLAHLWTNQLVKIKLPSQTFFQSFSQ